MGQHQPAAVEPPRDRRRPRVRTHWQRDLGSPYLSHRGYLGTGTVDFDTFFATLQEIGYGGPIVFESFSSKVVSPALSNTLGIWRERWQDGMDLARHARAFMRERLTDN